MLYEILKTSKLGASFAPDMYTALWAQKLARDGEVKTLSGAPPLSFKANGQPLLDYLISGNTVQSGTPTPDNPIIPQGTGDMTGNLWNAMKYSYTSLSDGSVWVYSSSLTGSVYRIPCIPNTKYTLYLAENVPISIWSICEVSTDVVPDASSTSVPTTGVYASSVPDSKSATFTTSASAKYILFQTNETAYDSVLPVIMLIKGTSKIPYEPYGIKIQISSGGNNLLDFEQLKTAPSGKIGSANVPHLLILQMKPNTYYTISSNGYGSIDATPADLYRSIYVNFSNGEYSVNKSNPVTVLTDDSGNVNIGFFDDRTNAQQYLNGEAQVWINEGSTPLPYEPYNRTTTNTYLGEVETVRYVKKLVLDGTEDFQSISSGNNKYFRLSVEDFGEIHIDTTYCTHFESVSITSSTTNVGIGVIHLSVLNKDALGIRPPQVSTTSLEDFTTYLTQQYNNGTPVMVWYVLATPTTGIVNEPLMKIGNYADTLSKEQAGVEIPTTRGTNTLDVLTDVKPSEIYIKYKS